MLKNIKKGFTLIELLVVITIVGILATVGVSSLTNYINDAKLSKYDQSVGEVRNGVVAKFGKSFKLGTGVTEINWNLENTGAMSGSLTLGATTLPVDVNGKTVYLYEAAPTNFNSLNDGEFALVVTEDDVDKEVTGTLYLKVGSENLCESNTYTQKNSSGLKYNSATTAGALTTGGCLISTNDDALELLVSQ